MESLSEKGTKMNVHKYEISKVIDRLKSIVQKNDAFPALGGVLVKKGYVIASNTEITMKVELEGCEDDYFIIPMKAFDLIKNLPEELIDINAGANDTVTIKTGNIKNKFQSYPPENFAFDIYDMEDAETISLNGKEAMEALGHVIFAAADVSANIVMTGINFNGTANKIKFAALDGHVVAVDAIPAEDAQSIDFTVPKNAIKKMVSMGILDDIELSYNKNAAIFKTKEYSIYTRLIEGNYPAYERMFADTKLHTLASRADLIGAMTRAKMCADENKPAVFEFENTILGISITSNSADYHENIAIKKTVSEPLRIGFSSKIVLDTLKAFTCDDVVINMTAPKMPIIVEAEGGNMKAAICPVVLR